MLTLYNFWARIKIVVVVLLSSFSVNASFSERFPEKCSTFHSNVGHYKEKFKCSFHSRTYWSRVTSMDCKSASVVIRFLFQQGWSVAAVQMVGSDAKKISTCANKIIKAGQILQAEKKGRDLFSKPTHKFFPTHIT